MGERGKKGETGGRDKEKSQLCSTWLPEACVSRAQEGNWGFSAGASRARFALFWYIWYFSLIMFDLKEWYPAVYDDFLNYRFGMFVLHVLDEPLQTPVLVGDLFVWRPADFDTQHKFQPDLRITAFFGAQDRVNLRFGRSTVNLSMLWWRGYQRSFIHFEIA